MSKKHTIEFAKETFNNLELDLLEDEYKDNHTLMDYICRTHPEDGIQKTSLKRVLKGIGCKTCGYERMAEKRKIKFGDLLPIAQSKNFELIEIVHKKYEDTLVKYICNAHWENGVQTTTLENFTRIEGCCLCGKESMADKKRLDGELVFNLFIKNNLIPLFNSQDYKDSRIPLPYICKNHMDKEQTITYHDLKDGHGCYYCGIESRIQKMAGENNPNWNPNLTDEERTVKRKYPEYKNWVKNVLKRDNYTCQCCEKYGGKLNAHHLDSYDWCIEGRTDIDNGVTLCINCHKDFHHIYGYGGNYKQEFDEWINLKLSRIGVNL